MEPATQRCCFVSVMGGPQQPDLRLKLQATGHPMQVRTAVYGSARGGSAPNWKVAAASSLSVTAAAIMLVGSTCSETTSIMHAVSPIQCTDQIPCDFIF